MGLGIRKESNATLGSFWLSSRFGLAFIGCFGIANVYSLRVNATVAVVCMLNHTALRAGVDDSGYHSNSTCDGALQNETNEDGKFLWSKNVQGLVLGSFYWGYILTQVLGGILAERFGGKHVLGWAMVITGVATLLCPVSANSGYVALIITRIVVGMGEGVVFPAMHAMWSNWAPPMERTILIGFAYAGAQIGNIVTFPIASVLCATTGWQSIFYVGGGFCLLWCLLWLLMTSSTPQTHRRISKIEREYITESLSSHLPSQDKPKLSEMPWAAIFKSTAVWAIIIGHMTGNFGTYLMLTSLPLYLKQVLKFDMKSNGLVAALPYIAFFISINTVTHVADYLRREQIMSTVHVRKLMFLIAKCGQAVFFVGAGYCGCGQEILAIILIVLAMTFSGLEYAGVRVNHVDIAPRYAGTLYGISNSFATIPGFVAPLVVSTLTKHESREEWSLVFWVAFCVLVFGSLFFAIFAKGDIQPWAAANRMDVNLELLGTEDGPHHQEMKRLRLS